MRLRANTLTEKPSSATAASIARRFSSRTLPPLRYLEMVDSESPVRRATSLIVDIGCSCLHITFRFFSLYSIHAFRVKKQFAQIFPLFLWKTRKPPQDSPLLPCHISPVLSRNVLSFGFHNLRRSGIRPSGLGSPAHCLGSGRSNDNPPSDSAIVRCVYRSNRLNSFSKCSVVSTFYHVGKITMNFF